MDGRAYLIIIRLGKGFMVVKEAFCENIHVVVKGDKILFWLET